MLRKLLIAAFVVQFLIVLLIAINTYLSINTIIERSEKSSYANKLLGYALQVSRGEKKYLYTGSQSSIKAMRESIGLINNQIGKIKSEFSEPSNIELLEKVNHSVKVYTNNFEVFILKDTHEDVLRKQLFLISKGLLSSLKSYISLQQKQTIKALSSQFKNDDLDEFKEVESAISLMNKFYTIRIQEKAFSSYFNRGINISDFLSKIQQFSKYLKKINAEVEGIKSKILLSKVVQQYDLYMKTAVEYTSVWSQQQHLMQLLDMSLNNFISTVILLESDQKKELQQASVKVKESVIITAIILIFFSLLILIIFLGRFNKGYEAIINTLKLISNNEPLSQHRPLHYEKENNEMAEIICTLIKLDNTIREVSFSYEQQRLLLNHIGEARFVISQEDRFTHISSYVEESLKSTGEELQQLLSNQICYKVVDELYQHNFLMHTQWPIENKLGNTISFEFEAVKLDQKHILIIGSFVSNNPENHDHNSKKPSALAFLDKTGKFAFANEPFRILMDTQGKSIYDMTSKDLTTLKYCSRSLSVQELNALASDKKPVEIIINPNRLEKKRYAYLRVLLLSKNKLGIKYALSFTDISNIRLSEERIHRLAFFDSLTSLPNRSNLLSEIDKRLDLATHQNLKVALLFLDLDDFKSINDSLGHYAGDKLLQEISQRLKQSQRESDFISRLGGDEFCLISGLYSEPETPTFFAERVISLVNKDINLNNGQVYQPSCSIGIAVYPDDGHTSQLLLQAADNAMYAAKNSGKNTFRYYDENMTKTAQTNMQLSRDVRLALKNNEFELHWQPIVNIKEKALECLEALVRWNHPKRGLVYPDDFIPTIERLGLSGELGRWVLTEASNQWKKWKDESHIDFHIAVNISAAHFEEENFVEQVSSIIKSTPMPPDFLEIEITESMTRNVEKHISVCQDLKLLNINISLDDFGTGYSSLAVLKRLQLDWLKIDREFIRDIKTDEKNKEIVVALIKMAKALDVKIIVEGVESREQLLFLNSLGCNYIQGYFFSKALPAKEIMPWISYFASHINKAFQ